MSLLVLGTMAYDAIETPLGKTDRIVGGSATYIAWAASNFYQPIRQLSIVGGDFEALEMEQLKDRGVDLQGVEIVLDAKSFFWSGKYHNNLNDRDTLITDLNVLAQFDPKVPATYQDCTYLMLGNLDPKLQLSVLQQLNSRPQLVVLDTMNFWMDIAMPALKEVLLKVDLLVLNDAEARQLSGEYALVNAAKAIQAMGPKYIIIKKGEHGALLFYEDKIFSAPALPLAQVYDPTGAGDSFAGGFLGYIAQQGNHSFETMKKAVIMGSVMASFCVEAFGPERLKTIQANDIEKRWQQFVALSTF